MTSPILSEEALAPEDVRKLAAYYAGRPMFAEVRFTVANAIADAILADRAARTPQTPMVGAEPMEAVAWRYRDAWGKWAYCQALDNLNGPTVNTEKQALYTASPLDRASVTVKARDAAIDDCALIAKYGMERSERDYRTKSPHSHSYRMAEEIYECIIALKASP